MREGITDYILESRNTRVRGASMAKEHKIPLKNGNTSFGNLLNHVVQPVQESHLSEILEEIAEICSESNEEFIESETKKKGSK